MPDPIKPPPTIVTDLTAFKVAELENFLVKPIILFILMCIKPTRLEYAKAMNKYER